MRRVALDCLRCGHTATMAESDLETLGCKRDASLVLVTKKLICSNVRAKRSGHIDTSTTSCSRCFLAARGLVLVNQSLKVIKHLPSRGVQPCGRSVIEQPKHLAGNRLDNFTPV